MLLQVNAGDRFAQHSFGIDALLVRENNKLDFLRTVLSIRRMIWKVLMVTVEALY